jgi:hypothetical protein
MPPSSLAAAPPRAAVAARSSTATGRPPRALPASSAAQPFPPPLRRCRAALPRQRASIAEESAAQADGAEEAGRGSENGANIGNGAPPTASSVAWRKPEDLRLESGVLSTVDRQGLKLPEDVFRCVGCTLPECQVHSPPREAPPRVWC